jgi:hypothetical protein
LIHTNHQKTKQSDLQELKTTTTSPTVLPSSQYVLPHYSTAAESPARPLVFALDRRRRKAGELISNLSTRLLSNHF